MKGRLMLILGAVLAGVFALAALVSLVWVPVPVEQLAVASKLKPIGTPGFALGTDHFGRDMLSMLMVGARTSIAVAILAVGIGMGFGVPLGLLAAARRGSLVDEVVMRGNDLVFAFPSLVIAILITAVFGPSATNAIIAIGIFNIPVFARVTRGGALSLWTLDYIRAAEVAGKGRARISLEHILPNIANLLIVQGTIQFSLGILAEAGLSYVGLGAQPPIPSWGRMLAEAQTMITMAPHMAILPGLAIVLTVLGLNLMGDGLRDLLDPRLRRAR
ncbi:peptide/nickel transport system permease protein [Gemmobacter megaterium]|uniref:Peptide/nickel transport system permease protein n=1 Tax=Gemmobacter megaterium TaxID=1086013 RepID=A0A1N7PFG7_9RHOB|nr:ABC transporter permease [Gemmobacter megaterium]GGE18557.1 peptide ABC transporter permease [Gemmobacter megaterium]SIT09383.1 peptide/nickel transport system permease protein [Gemmobacter megaterium]